MGSPGGYYFPPRWLFEAERKHGVEIRSLLWGQADRMIRQELKVLEGQAAMLMYIMGYAPDELIVAQYPDGHKEVVPRVLLGL